MLRWKLGQFLHVKNSRKVFLIWRVIWINNLFQKLICDRLHSIDGIRWSPNDELLCIWCSSPAEPKLIVYSTVWEKLVAAFSPLEIIQLSEVTYNYKKELKGIENIEWSPSGQLLAVIGFNEVVIYLSFSFIYLSIFYCFIYCIYLLHSIFIVIQTNNIGCSS